MLITTTRGTPDAKTLHSALYGWAFHTANRSATKLSGDEAAAITWMRSHSIKVTALDEPERRSALIRRALDALALTLDGHAAAATTIARKRAVFTAS